MQWIHFTPSFWLIIIAKLIHVFVKEKNNDINTQIKWHIVGKITDKKTPKMTKTKTNSKKVNDNEKMK